MAYTAGLFINNVHCDNIIFCKKQINTKEINMYILSSKFGLTCNVYIELLKTL